MSNKGRRLNVTQKFAEKGAPMLREKIDFRVSL